MRFTWLNAAPVFFLFLAVFPLRISAQVNFASVTGQVVDSGKGGVPRVNLLLKSTTTGLVRNTTTDSRGFYEFIAVKPGEYQLQAEAPGFEKEARNMVLTVNQSLRLDLTMQIGATKEVVNVRGTPPALRTNDATLGELIDPTLTTQLPLDGQHVLDLAVLAPGTTSNMNMGVQDGNQNQLYWRPGQGTEFSAAGNRANSNYYLLDGTTDSDPTFWTLSLSPSPDAIQEFKVHSPVRLYNDGGRHWPRAANQRPHQLLGTQGMHPPQSKVAASSRERSELESAPTDSLRSITRVPTETLHQSQLAAG